MNSRRAVLLFVAALIAAFFVFDLNQYLTLDFLKSQQQAFLDYYASHQAVTIAIYFLLYVAVTSLSLPGAAIMTLAGGAIFGLLYGVVIISFASTIGATLAFVISRFLLRDYVQKRFGDKLKAVNDGIERDGDFYLFTLRLIPIFPFFIINLVMGLTPMKAWRFYVVSQIGMLPGTIVYVNAGSQLGKLDSLAGILSPSLLLSFALLGLFPLLAKKFVEWLRRRKIRARHPQPEKFDYNLVVIGGGSAGLVSALIAATVKARVALIEKHKMGGDCLNTGCVPSKALIRSAKMLNYARRARDFGLQKTEVSFDFAEVMERIQRVIKKIEPHDSVERFTQLGVDVKQGKALIRSPFEVEVDGEILTTRNIIIATGARPVVPKIPGIEAVDYLTSDNLWHLRQQPRRLLVLGGGPIGCELAQSFQRLGCEVTLVQRGDRILPREDAEISAMVERRFVDEGMRVLTSHTASRFTDANTLVCKHAGEAVEIRFDRVLIALGRQANTEDFGLEALGIRLTRDGTIAADPLLRTNFPNIYVCGDVTGPYQFTHTASHQAWYASVNALFSPFKTFRVDYTVIPWATYTDPEVARVGLNEQEAREKGIAVEVTTYGIDDLDRAIADSEDYGLVKVLTAPGKDRILGVTIVGSHAGDLIAEFVFAMKHGLGLNKILATIHIYPTLAEANKFVAGNWKKNHKPERLLDWVGRFHAWRRGNG